MKILVEYPVTVSADNIGAIFMASKIATMYCTKHVDIRYKYVDEYAEDGVIKIIFVKSADNSAELLEKQSKKMVGEKL